MNTLQQRLKEALGEKAGATMSDMARFCGLSRTAISLWFSGSTQSIEGENLIRASEYLGVTPKWLATGEGSKRPRGLLDTAAYENTMPGPDIVRRVPLISFVKAGAWAETYDPYYPGEAEEWLPYINKNGEQVFALRIDGDSMTAPHGRSYPHGCIIFVDPTQRSPVSGDRVVAVVVGAPKATFKVFKEDDGRRWLQPLNPDRNAYPVITDPFKIIGTVTGTWVPE